MVFFRFVPRFASKLVSRRLSTSRALCSDLTLTFASPSAVFYNKVHVKQVDVPGITGSFGVLAEHVPTIANLRPGVVAVTEEDGALKKFFVSSGSVTVNSDSTVQVLAEEAVTVDQLDPQAVRDGLAKAQSELASASGDVAKAEAQIVLEAFEAMAASI